MSHENGPSLPREDPPENQNQPTQTAEETDSSSTRELPEVTEQAVDETYGLEDNSAQSAQTDPATRRRSMVRRGLAALALGGAVAAGIFGIVGGHGDHEADEHAPGAVPTTSAPAYGYGSETMDKNNAEQIPAEETANKLAGSVLKTLQDDKHAKITTTPKNISGGATVSTYNNESSISDWGSKDPHTQVFYNAKTRVMSFTKYQQEGTNNSKSVEVTYHLTRHNPAASFAEDSQLTAEQFAQAFNGEKDLTSMTATVITAGQEDPVILSMKRGPNMEKLPEIIDTQGVHTDQAAMQAALQKMEAVATDLH